LEFSKDAIEESFMVFMNQFQFEEKHIHNLRKAVRENLGKTTEDKQKKREQLKGNLTKLKEKQSSLIQKNFQGVITDTVLRQQLDLIDIEQLNTSALLARFPERKINVAHHLDSLEQFLKNPSAVWKQLPISGKIKLQWFEFPKGVAYDGVNFRTDEICRLFKVKKKILPDLSHGAGLMHKTSNSPKVTNSKNHHVVKGNSQAETTETEEEYWEKIEGEMDTLGKILRGEEEKDKDEFDINDIFSHLSDN
jgi:hypothetical protein